MTQARTMEINSLILNLYSKMLPLSFPIDAKKAISLLGRCRLLTYDMLAEISHASHQDIIMACESYAGCTQFDPAQNRYLVLVNTSSRNTICKERINWTVAHEIGHIVCGHFLHMSGECLSSDFADREYEEEADYFAACFLAPMPAICNYAKSVQDIKAGFGLSQSAAERRFRDYKNYLRTGSGYFTDSAVWKFFSAHPFYCKSLTRRQEVRLPNVKAIDIVPDDFC